MLDPTTRQSILDVIGGIPIVETIGLRIDRLDLDVCVATMPRRPGDAGIFRSVHGGLLTTLADTIACFALLTRTGPEQAMTTTDLHVRFLAPVLTDVVGEARVIKAGRTLCPVHVDVRDTDGRLAAVAQVTYMRLPGHPER